VNALHSLAIVLWGRNELNAAVTTIEDALTPLADSHPDRGPLRHTLAQVFHARGDLGRAVELLTDVRAGYEKAFGADNERLQPVLLDLARCHTALGDGLEARRLLVRAMLRASPYPRPLDEAATLLSLADSHRNLGDPDRAHAGSNEALAMVRRSVPANDPVLLDYLTHAAESARLAKQFGRAAGLLGEAERIVLTAGGERHPLRARVWMEQAALEAARGQNGSATRLYDQAVNLAKSVLGEDHPDHALTLRLCGMHALATKRYQAAEGHLRTRLAVVRRTLGDDHPTVALAQQAVSEVLRQAGNLRVAENEAREAEATLRRSDVPADALHAGALHGLGVIVRQQGRLPEATRFFERALEIDRTTAAQEEQADSLDTHYQLALIEAASGAHTAAVGRLRRLLADQENLLSAFACLPPGPNRDGLLKYPQLLVGMLLTLTAGRSDQCLPEANAVVRWNALSPATLVHGERAALRQQHPADAEALDRLFDLNVQIAHRHFSGAGLEGAALHRELLAKWTAERDRLENELCDRVRPLARVRVWREVNATAVRTRLPADTAAVELIRYHTADFQALCREEDKRGPVRHAAVVIHPTNEPKVIDLGGAEALDGQKLRAAVALHLAGCSRVTVGHGGLHRRVWGGLTPEVQGVRSCRELVSPLLAAPPAGFLARVRGWLGG
jgi:tetratricopeptide (TPR) repeat protein